MKTKLLSVIAASSLAVTSFASLAITASAASYNVADLYEGFILQAGDTITANDGVDFSVLDTAAHRYIENGQSCTVPNNYQQYQVSSYYYSEADDIFDDPECRWIDISPYVIPATATYAQVGSDYTSETETDNIASLWKITVKAGTDSIEKLDVKLGAVSSQEGTQSLDAPAITGAEVVLGVVTNLSGTDTEAKGFTVAVNGSDIAAAKASN